MAAKFKSLSKAAVVLSVACAIPILVRATEPESAKTAKSWMFDHEDDREGWTVPDGERGRVHGGALWITLGSLDANVEKIHFNPILSPDGLEIAARDVNQIRMRILNLTPATDFVIRWRTKETDWGPSDWREGHFLNGAFELPPQSRRCTLKGDFKEWQEITCSIDGRWQGTIEQLSLEFVPAHIYRGDIWIGKFEIARGPPEPPIDRPDISSANVVPVIVVPGLSQQGFDNAFATLNTAMVVELPIYGFTHPVISPGGYYRGGGWWIDDSTLALEAAKWTNQEFAENVLRGFSDVQAGNPDGHIDGSGGDWPDRGSLSNHSGLPVIFEVAFDIARRTSDRATRLEIYRMMRKYLDWWLSPVKRDARTGLVSSIFEETFGEVDDRDPTFGSQLEPQTIAAVDTNVQVAIGALRVAHLARSLGEADDYEKYNSNFLQMKNAINLYLWDEKDGAYYNYDLIKGARRKRLIVSTFDPLRVGIASIQQSNRLVRRLIDPKQFNWGTVPLTSMAKTDPDYREALGDYDQRAWLGDVWTVRNMTVIKGLEEAGYPDLAAELNWQTIKAFQDNYWEYLLPSSGKGQGAQGYSWTASQYGGAIIDHLFGIEVDRINEKIQITPHVPKQLYGRKLTLDNLILPGPGDARLSVSVEQSTAKSGRITVKITGTLPSGALSTALPGGKQSFTAPVQSQTTAIFH
jgi:hypothetical protein